MNNDHDDNLQRMIEEVFSDAGIDNHDKCGIMDDPDFADARRVATSNVVSSLCQNFLIKAIEASASFSVARALDEYVNGPGLTRDKSDMVSHLYAHVATGVYNDLVSREIAMYVRRLQATDRLHEDHFDLVPPSTDNDIAMVESLARIQYESSANALGGHKDLKWTDLPDKGKEAIRTGIRAVLRAMDTL